MSIRIYVTLCDTIQIASRCEKSTVARESERKSVCVINYAFLSHFSAVGGGGVCVIVVCVRERERTEPFSGGEGAGGAGTGPPLA